MRQWSAWDSFTGAWYVPCFSCAQAMFGQMTDFGDKAWEVVMPLCWFCVGGNHQQRQQCTVPIHWLLHPLCLWCVCVSMWCACLYVCVCTSVCVYVRLDCERYVNPINKAIMVLVLLLNLISLEWLRQHVCTCGGIIVCMHYTTK